MSWLKRLIGGAKPSPEAPSARPAAPVDVQAVAARHALLTQTRRAAYEELFGCEPTRIITDAEMVAHPDARFPIDIFVFTLESHLGDLEVAVTNGMSDQRMVSAAEPGKWLRKEIIQYFRKCTPAHAARLRDMAWLPLYDQFILEERNTINWEHAAVEGTPWSRALFLSAVIRPHAAFEMQVMGDPVRLLWHIPLSPAEREYAVKRGVDALLDRMEAVDLPWVFDESTRRAMVE